MRPDTSTRTVARGVSAVSWGAIIAGTAVAAATSLLLFALAAGLDLASLSSWPHRGLSGTSVTTLAAITLIVTQWIAAGLGGYITAIAGAATARDSAPAGGTSRADSSLTISCYASATQPRKRP